MPEEQNEDIKTVDCDRFVILIICLIKFKRFKHFYVGIMNHIFRLIVNVIFDTYTPLCFKQKINNLAK